MMLSVLSIYEQSRNDLCFLCSNTLSEIKSYPNVCDHLFHYKCLRKYVDNRLERNESISCPICNKIFNQIANRYKKSKEILFQNVILSSDETQCCICFSKYKCPVASTDTCTHTFCFECIKKWCTFKHECPMDRMPIKLLLMSDFPGGHITKKEEPPPIEQDLNGDGDNDEIVNTTCEVCFLGNNDHLLLLCDNCNRGYHIYCLTSPLSDIPEGDWFCEDCSNDMPVNNTHIPRGIRGFQRRIDDLQRRLDSATRNSNPPNRNRRIRQRPNRESRGNDSDWSDTIEIRVTRTTRSRPTPVGSSDEGIRRSLRNRRPVSDNDTGPETSRIVPALRNRRRVISESEEEDNEAHSSPITNVTNNRNTGYSRSRVSNHTNNRNRPSVLTNESSSSHRDDTNISGRNRQGSLSSEPESEIESTKRQMKVVESSSSESCSSMASGSDAESLPSLQVTTRKRARDTIQEDPDDDCPIPRPVKKPRLIDESSSSDSVESTESQSDNSSDEKNDDIESDAHDIAESELSQEDEITVRRQRHISSSSSLSTIPCRVSTRLLPSKSTTSRRAPTLEEIYTESSNTDGTDSDYDPSCETSRRPSSASQNTTIRLRPSTSAVARQKSKRSRKTTRKTKSSSKRKSSSLGRKSNSKRKSSSKRKSTTKRRKSNRKTRSSRNQNQSTTSSSSQNNSEQFTSTRLSLFGREKQLPVVSDEELNIKHCPNPHVEASRARVGNTSGSILSEISEAQSNLRTISLSTISRQSDGTLIYKPRSDHFDNLDSNNQTRTTSSSSHQSHSNNTVSGTVSLSRHSTMASALQTRTLTETVPITRPQPVLVSLTRPPEISVPVIGPAVTHAASTQPPIAPISALIPTPPVDERVQKPKLNPTNTSPAVSSSRDSLIIEIKKIISKCLRKYHEKGQISTVEVKSLTNRITEKITKGDIQRKMPGKSSVKDFSVKYLEFYLRKRK